MGRWLGTLGLLLAVLAVPAAAVENQAETTLVYPCRPASRPIHIDGRLEPGEWDGAIAASGFTISGSDTLAPQQAVMRLLHDDKHLYIGVKCLESSMKTLKAPRRVLDGEFWLDDSIEFFIDANHDHETHWQFATTAAAMRYDNVDGDSTWNATWTTAAQRGTDFWSVEIALPFAELKLPAPAPGALWGFNLCRERQAGGKLQLYNWANVRRVFKNAHLFGHVYFVDAAWKPTAATVAAAARKAEGADCRLFAPHGIWQTPRGGKPEHVPYRALLRRCAPGGRRLMAELRTIYGNDPTLPLHKQFAQLNTTYATVQTLIASTKPIDAETWANAALFLGSLNDKAGELYWQVRLAQLNKALDQPDKE